MTSKNQNVLIDSLGGIKCAKQYLKWMRDNNVLMGSYRCQYGFASFYDTTLQRAIEAYENDD